MRTRRETIFPLFFLGLLLVFFTFLYGCSRSIPPTSPTPVSSTPSRSSDQIKTDTPAALKIMLSADGIYRIKAADLQAAGLPVETIDFQKASLTLRGQPVPVWANKESGGWVLYFYGHSTNSLYTLNNVYWLQFGSDSSDPMKTAAPAAGYTGNMQALETYTYTLRTEQQIIYYPQVTRRRSLVLDFDPCPQITRI